MKKSTIIDLARGLKKAEKTNSEILHLTVNENRLSQLANHFLSSRLSERYFFGAGDKHEVVDFDAYTFRGMSEVDALVNQAKAALIKMSGAKSVNLNCFSGLHAMMCTILTTTNPGDVVMSLPFDDGGHLATKGIIESVGRIHTYAAFNQKQLDFDVTETVRRFKANKAKVIYIDISVHLHPLAIESLRRALPKEALIIYDASHSLGLILGGNFPSPFQLGADVVCSNTHKTFAGPQSGLILFKNEQFGNKANQIINTTFVSSVHTARLIALSISILEHAQFGQIYSSQVIKNARTLGTQLLRLGHSVRRATNGEITNNEQIHLFIDGLGDRRELYKNLLRNNISTNFMKVLGGRSFARLGTQDVTRLGMVESDMNTVATLIDNALKGKNIQNQVIDFVNTFTNAAYSFDSEFDEISHAK